MKPKIEFVVSSASTRNVFTGVFQRQEALIHVLNFELRRLCTVLLGQIVRADDVNHRLAVGFETVDTATEVYLKQPLCNELILVDFAFSKPTHKDMQLFSLGVIKHVKAFVQYLLAEFPENSEFTRSISCFSLLKADPQPMGCSEFLNVARKFPLRRT